VGIGDGAVAGWLIPLSIRKNITVRHNYHRTADGAWLLSEGFAFGELDHTNVCTA